MNGYHCDEKLKIKVGQLFVALTDGENFYTRYAHNVGFVVHRSTQCKIHEEVICLKKFVCSKECVTK